MRWSWPRRLMWAIGLFLLLAIGYAIRQHTTRIALNTFQVPPFLLMLESIWPLILGIYVGTLFLKQRPSLSVRRPLFFGAVLPLLTLSLYLPVSGVVSWRVPLVPLYGTIYPEIAFATGMMFLLSLFSHGGFEVR